MSGDDYVIDENGTWNDPSAALKWYRAEVERLRQLVPPESRVSAVQDKDGHTFDEMVDIVRTL
jgi:hypothetical protein